MDVRLTRTPALFPRKTKHRIYPEADRVFDGELRDNYSSARESAEQIQRQFEQEVEMEAMVRCDLEQARAEYGDDLFIASLGAVPKADKTSDATYHTGAAHNEIALLRLTSGMRCFFQLETPLMGCVTARSLFVV